MTRSPGEHNQLSRVEERMRSIVDHVVDGIISIDDRGTITTFNRAAEGIFGYTSAEVIGQNVRILMPEPYRGEHDSYIANYLHTGHAKIIGTGREVVGRRKDGSVFPMELAISEFQVDQQRHFTGIVRDITERKRAEEARREAEERMRSVVDHVIDGIITIDARGAIQSFNPAAEKLFGYGSAEVLGHNVNMLMPEPYREQHDGYLHNYLSTGHAKIIGIGREVVGKRKDGSTFPMELAVSEFHMAGGRYFTGIVRDITERKRMEGELHQRLQELADADRQKNEFLAMLGHELRNPLAPMRNALHILKIPAATPAMAEQAREIMDRQLQHMVRLVDDLLDVSRIVRGKVELQKEMVDLRDPVRRAWETAQPVIDANGHQLLVDLPAEPIWVNGDMVRLSQIIANLLTNAAKYAGRSARIFISVRRDAETARVAVRDTGSGIEPELLPRIFDLFVQGDRTPERAQGGLGIGLTLVRRLVEMHGGTVRAYSGGPGQGSEFVVTLPVVVQAAGAREPALAGGLRSRTQSGGWKVLVVDDNVDACDSIGIILMGFGYQVKCLYDGPSVLPAALQWPPDVFVLDIGLPGMSGLEVAAQLRQQAQFQRTPIVALTGYGQADDRQRSQSAGIDMHLTKPADPQGLHRWLTRLLHPGAASVAGEAAPDPGGDASV